jgi:two-component system nitrogen regulation sensor histidine kinase GlnL
MVFFPLVSGREGGSGVGLTLAQSLIQRHEGVIHLVSEPGFTCFSVYIPIQAAHDKALGTESKPQYPES